jgi:hypothetical protein
VRNVLLRQKPIMRMMLRITEQRTNGIELPEYDGCGSRFHTRLSLDE